MSEDQTVKLYNGTETITFTHDPHSYYWHERDKYLVGPTTPVEKTIAKQSFLGPWHAKECQLEIMERVQEFVDVNDVGEEWLRVDMATFADITLEAKGKAKRLSEEAKRIGSFIHAFAEEYLMNDEKAVLPDHPVAAKCCSSLVTWLSDNKEKIISVERIVLSRKYQFSGRMDLLMKTDSGGLMIGDIKSSSDFYVPDMPMQLAGYALAVEEELQRPVDNGLIIRIDKKTGRVQERGYRLTPETKQAFVDSLKLYRSMLDMEGQHGVARKTQVA